MSTLRIKTKLILRFILVAILVLIIIVIFAEFSIINNLKIVAQNSNYQNTNYVNVPYQKLRVNELREWIEILANPVTTLFVAWVLNRRFAKRDKEEETRYKEVENRRQEKFDQQEYLNSYFIQITSLFVQ